jgi:hypothetical protein
MKYGVVYKFKLHHKINGTLFYCFEYFKFLRKYKDFKFYIVGITDKDLKLVLKIFSDKYNTSFDNIIPISLVDLYKENLDKTLVLDIKSFNECKEFLTNEVHCFSNETHDFFRYKNNRSVTYYGSYHYQRFDVECLLKLNFDLFHPLKQNGYGVFVSCLSPSYILQNLEKWKTKFNRPIILKQSECGFGNLFDMIDAVHYVHTQQDTNNRIIPESFFYNKPVTIEKLFNEQDSIELRYNDILINGLKNYTLTENDAMVQACLK